MILTRPFGSGPSYFIHFICIYIHPSSLFHCIYFISSSPFLSLCSFTHERLLRSFRTTVLSWTVYYVLYEHLLCSSTNKLFIVFSMNRRSLWTIYYVFNEHLTHYVLLWTNALLRTIYYVLSWTVIPLFLYEQTFFCERFIMFF